MSHALLFELRSQLKHQSISVFWNMNTDVVLLDMVLHELTHQSYNDILQLLIFKFYCRHLDLDDNFYHTIHSIDKKKIQFEK